MAEYIEREALIRYLKEKKKALENIDCVNMAKDIGRIIKHIEKDKIPAADVVEVVRCKDCKHQKNDTEYCRTHNKCYCELDDTIKAITHYCGYGERKSKETVSLVDGHIDKSNRCVSCGALIPEGAMMCPICERRYD